MKNSLKMCVPACVGAYPCRPSVTSPTKWELQRIVGFEDTALSSTQSTWRKAKCRSCLPSQSAGPAKGIRLLAQEASHPALKMAREEACTAVSVCLTRGAHLAGQLCNLTPQGESFFPTSNCDQILPWSTRLKCPCNFYPEERQIY